MQIRNLRWWIAALLAAASALSYLDRQSLPVAVVEIHKTIPITDTQYSWLVALFLLSYGLMYAIGGRIIDLLGTKRGYALMITWWSLATIFHGFVTNVLELGIARFLLGIGEGGGFPGSAKAVSEWFPAKERSFAFGIFNTGSSLGAVAAPPLIAFVIIEFSWRWVFYFTGLLGIAWLGFWWKLYDRPNEHKLITADERKYLQVSLPGSSSPSQVSVIPWARLFQYRQTWGLVLSSLVSNSAWYFFIFWLPKYLADVRHLDIAHIGYYAWIPYAFAGAGSFVGGWFSSFLIARRVSLDHSRKIALGISAGVMPASLFIVRSPLSVAIIFFSVAFLGFQFWSTISQTVASDIFPASTVGSIIGLMGAAGSLGAVLFNVLVGWFLTHYHSYSAVMTIVGLLLPLSFFIILFVVGRIEPLDQPENLATP